LRDRLRGGGEGMEGNRERAGEGLWDETLRRVLIYPPALE